MSYIVGRISGDVKIDPEAGGHGRQRKQKRSDHKAEGRDRVSISDEARQRSLESGEETD